VQANILAAIADKPEAVNQVYNVAFGARTTLNQLYQELRMQMLPNHPHLANASPTYRDFRAGDVRHSLADITKAQRLLGYAPTHDLHAGLQEAIGWYMENSVS